ncbi:hypothetical protein D3C87_1709770 [compost metagenome]
MLDHLQRLHAQGVRLQEGALGQQPGLKVGYVLGVAGRGDLLAQLVDADDALGCRFIDLLCEAHLAGVAALHTSKFRGVEIVGAGFIDAIVIEEFRGGIAESTGA